MTFKDRIDAYHNLGFVMGVSEGIKEEAYFQPGTKEAVFAALEQIKNYLDTTKGPEEDKF